jgi:ADP-ribose 1''-phosphate phosphatase
MPIVYKKGSLFDAPRPRTLVHACNTQGIWGAGVAKQVAARYPAAHAEYRRACVAQGASLLGRSLLLPTDDYVAGKCATWIVCLFTSKSYGANVDTPHEILDATSEALYDLFQKRREYLDTPSAYLTFESPRFNAGRFNVPWEETEHVLANVLAAYDPSGQKMTWNVWTP